MSCDSYQQWIHELWFRLHYQYQTISNSLSLVSISQGNPKKNKTTNDRLDKENNELSIKSTEKYKPHYLKVSDRALKQLLSNVIDLQFKELWQEYYRLSLKNENRIW